MKDIQVSRSSVCGLIVLFEPTPIASCARRWARLAGSYSEVFGFTRFADLFLVDPKSGHTAYLFTERPELVPLKFNSISEFKSEFLLAAATREHLLREQDCTWLSRKLGEPTEREIFLPVPYPVIGGSGAIETFQKGDVWTHLDIYAQTTL